MAIFVCKIRDFVVFLAYYYKLNALTHEVQNIGLMSDRQTMYERAQNQRF